MRWVVGGGRVRIQLGLHAGTCALIEANASERGNGYERGGGGQLFTSSFPGCLHCGYDNHKTFDCTAALCDYCGLKFCFGSRKRGSGKARDCLVKKVVGGGKVTDADVGFNGRPLPQKLIDQINDRATKMKAKETNTTEVQTEKNVIGDYDDVAEGDSD